MQFFFDVIVAVDSANGIGKKQSLAWSLKSDMDFFKQLTISQNPIEVFLKFDLQWKFNHEYLNHSFKEEGIENVVIMGRKTWESLPSFAQPLPQRLNVVLSQKESFIKNAVCVSSLNDALEKTQKNALRYVIGGGKVYREAIQTRECRYVYMTQLKQDFSCDTFFPNISATHEIVAESPWNQHHEIEYRFTCFVSKKFVKNSELIFKQ